MPKSSKAKIPAEFAIVRQDAALERMVLSAIVSQHPQGMDALESLVADDFFNADYHKLFATLAAMKEHNEPIEIAGLYNHVEKLADLEGENLIEFLVHLKQEILPSDDILGSVKKLRRLGMCRQSTHVLSAAEMAIAGGETAVDEVIDTAIEGLSEIMRSYEEFDSQGVSYKDAALAAVNELRNHLSLPKIYTGVPELDDMTGGFRPGELVVLTAETGVGKTLLAQQIRIEACRKGYVSLFCSGEMPAQQLLRRELAALAHVPPGNMRREESLTNFQMADLMRATQHQCTQCRILDGELHISRIRRVARARKAKTGLHLLILDYDELIDAPGKDENEQLRRLVRMSKSLGMELQCVVILISQLRKESGKEPDDARRPPSLSRVYGSGAKIKHASFIILVQRPWEEDLRGTQTEATLWLLKARDGRTGAVKAKFDIATLRFAGAPLPPPESQEDLRYAPS